MANQIAVDVHSLSVVWNVVFGHTPTGAPSIKESWIKVKLLGAEGSISEKFRLLFNSPLQFKIGTSSRTNDAKASDTYYPRGKEVAQLFSILGNVIGTVDMEGFDSAKWEKRFPSSSLAAKRLREYADINAPAPVPEIAPPVADTVVIPVDANNRMSQEAIPVVPPARVKTRAKANA